MLLSIPPEIGYVMLVIILLCLQGQAFGTIVGGRQRGKVFTEEFMKKNFGQEYTKITGKQIGSGGLPDSGSGYYSNRLSYEDWFNLNNAMRTHGNFLQFLPMTIAFLLIAGIYFPISSASIGLGIFFTRLLYTIGYTTYGPPGRTIGFLLTLLLTVCLGILGIISSIFLITGKIQSVA